MSKDYNLYFGNTNGLPFPNTRAVNATGPTATDGTEFIAELVDDVWLEKQAELDFYDFPPADTDNLPGIDAGGYPYSQPLLLKYMNYGTPGVIVPWCAQNDPATISAVIGCDIRLLLLQGQGINRTLDDYKLLDALCYNGDANNGVASSFYHATDAAGTIRNIAGNYLILPDLRGYVLRGWDPSGTIDPDGAGRLIGDYQQDAAQGHRHNMLTTTDGGVSSGLVSSNYGTGPTTPGSRQAGWGPVHNQELIVTTNPISDGVNGTPRISSETRMKNVITRFAIYY